MSGRRAMLAGTAVVLCVAGGAFAGVDAAGQVDVTYRTAPMIRTSPATVVREATAVWDRHEAPIAAAPSPGVIWGREVGRDEIAYMDTRVAPAWRDEEPAVRVHRGADDAPPEEPASPDGEDALAADESDAGAEQAVSMPAADIAILP